MHLLFCAHLISIFSFLWGVELGHFYFKNPLMVSGLCNLSLQKCSFLYIQTLHNDCSHIEDVHLLFCIHLIFFFFRIVELRHYYVCTTFGALTLCKICNSNSFIPFYSNLANQFQTYWKCAPPVFVQLWYIFWMLNLDIFYAHNTDLHLQHLWGACFV